MRTLPEDLPDEPVLLKQMLLDARKIKETYATNIIDLKEQIKLLRDRIFGRNSAQTVEPNTPQLALFNEPESEPMPPVGDAEEEGVAPAPRGGKRKPLSADLPRIEVIHELPEH
jgi:transposase